ncbi:MAG: T9SS type A sorting domain-containing protein, partial [Bacteroidales bacterium]|nr:T9SS type A sorting domain-containing protein [Bacteroidales bacterium]
GNHTFSWTYEKDFGYVGGLDRAWIDDIQFPITDVLSSASEVKNVLEDWSIYPNPMQDNLTISVEKEKAFAGTLQVINSLGEIVYQTVITENSGKINVIINLSFLNSGLYHVVLKGDEIMQSKTLIKL